MFLLTPKGLILKKQQFYLLWANNYNVQNIKLMMEESQVGVNKNHIIGISCGNNGVVLNRSRSSSNVLDTWTMSTVNVIREGEESIRRHNSVLQLAHPFLALFSSKEFRNCVEVGFPGFAFDTLLYKRHLVHWSHLYMTAKHTSPVWLVTKRSIALDLSARLVPFLKSKARTLGWWRNHQLSALSPARRVQWIRDCWPAPRPITIPFLA